MFKNFEYIIVVNYRPFFDPTEQFVWAVCADAKQYFYPVRELGNNAVWSFQRVIWNEWEQRWNINEIGGEDKLFVATNNKDDAVMITLKYS